MIKATSTKRGRMIGNHPRRGQIINAAKQAFATSARGDETSAQQWARNFRDACPTDVLQVTGENGRKYGVVCFVGPDGAVHRATADAMREWSKVDA